VRLLRVMRDMYLAGFRAATRVNGLLLDLDGVRLAFTPDEIVKLQRIFPHKFRAKPALRLVK
jgi:hypothetical protein